MGVPLFKGVGQFRTRIVLPRGYAAQVRWRPQLGDHFPNFTANSTCGQINFHNWAEGNWTFLFSHPAAFTPVCSTEIADVAFHGVDFKARGVKPLCISADTLPDLSEWAAEVEETFRVKIDFPLVSDVSHAVTKAAGMEHPKEISGMPIRKSFLIDPSLRIRMIFEYPVLVGRSMDETLRVIDALQRVESGSVATPSGWEAGDPVLKVTSRRDTAPRTNSAEPKWTELRSYLQVLHD